MAVRLGKYAQLRPDPNVSINQTISAEYKRDLMDENVDVFGKNANLSMTASKDSNKKSKSKKSKKSKKRKKDDDSDSESDRSKSRERGDKSDRKRRRRKGELGPGGDKDNKSSDKRKSTNSNTRSRDDDRSSSKLRSDRGRVNSQTSGKISIPIKARTPSPVSSYNSPSSLEQDTDLESNGLDLKYDLEPLIHHLHLDRELFNKQIFKIIRGRRRRHLLPKILKDMPDKELKLNCLSELATWSNKRLRVLMRTGDLMSADAKGALIDAKQIFEEMKKRDEAATVRENKRIEAIEKGLEPEPEDEELPGDVDAKAGSESEEEDIEAMRANLELWRKAKFEEELQKLRAKHKIEAESLAKDLEDEITILNKQISEKEAAKKKLDELNQKMAKVRREVEKRQAEKAGLVLVEKTTLKKEKPVVEIPEPEGPDALEEKSSDDQESSLDMDDIEASGSNNLSEEEDIDAIPLADSPSRQQQPKLKKKKESKKKKKKKAEEEAGDGGPVGPKANLCPEFPYKPKKDRKKIVKDWLAAIGQDGPPLPVPEENYYPDYCDPNTKNAEEEIQKLQDAYDIERTNKGRTDGKNVIKITGEAVFEDDSEDENEDANAGNNVAKRMLMTMLNRNKPKVEKVKAEAGVVPPVADGTSPKTDFIKTEESTSQQNGVNGHGSQPVAGQPRSTKTESLGAVYQRQGDQGSLRFAKDAAREKIVGERLKTDRMTSGGLTKKALLANQDIKFKDQEAKKSEYQLKREAQQKMETEMRAKAIKSMMEKMQKKKVKQEAEDRKAATHEGAFPWQDDYVDDDDV